MVFYIGGDKIKDTGDFGVYFSPGKTNCLTYTPKNINLTLSNGILTLKKGSKVYVPNGKNTDGSNKFDEVVIESDLSYTEKADTTCLLYYSPNKKSILRRGAGSLTGYSGSEANKVTNGAYYATDTNFLYSVTSSGEEKVSLPLAMIASTTADGITSINQIFDWCGYIGSTAFVLPGVKGLIPNGFNTDGTYKSIEFTTSKVSTFTTTNTGTIPFVIRTDGIVFSAYSNVYDEVTNKNSLGLIGAAGTYTASSGVITSLTPYNVKSTNDLQEVREIYNGSDLVYRYQEFAPGTVFVNSANTGTKTYTLDRGVYKVALCGARGKDVTTVAGGYAWGNAGSGGGFVEVLFYVSEKTSVTLYSTSQGNGASYMNFGSTRMITANGGADGAGAAGTCSVSSSLDVIETIKNVTGNQGTTGLASTPSVATVSTYGNWGSTANPNGGVRLEYLRINK